MYPVDLLIDGLEPSAGGIMVLGEVLFEHSLTKFGVIPGNLFSLNPGFGWSGSVDDVGEFQCGLLLFLFDYSPKKFSESAKILL